MKFEQLQKDVVYRVTKGNDTFPAGELVWIDSLSDMPHLNSVQEGACLDEEDIPDGIAELEFIPEPNWDVQTKRGPGGYSRAVCLSRGNTVLISIHKRYLDKILSGEKVIEVRTNWPRVVAAPFVVLLYETGTAGGSKRVRAKAICSGCDTLHDSDLWDENAATRKAFSQKSCLSEKELKEYMATHTALFGWKLEKVQSFECALADLGVSRAPQSWSYFDSRKIQFDQ